MSYPISRVESLLRADSLVQWRVPIRRFIYEGLAELAYHWRVRRRVEKPFETCLYGELFYNEQVIAAYLGGREIDFYQGVDGLFKIDNFYKGMYVTVKTVPWWLGVRALLQTLDSAQNAFVTVVNQRLQLQSDWESVIVFGVNGRELVEGKDYTLDGNEVILTAGVANNGDSLKVEYWMPDSNLRLFIPEICIEGLRKRSISQHYEEESSRTATANLGPASTVQMGNVRISTTQGGTQSSSSSSSAQSVSDPTSEYQAFLRKYSRIGLNYG